MTLPRRSGPSPAALLFGATAIVVILLLGLLAIRGDPIEQLRHVWASFFPPQAVTAQGAETRDLYDIVFAIAAVIFLFVEGLIVFAVLRYRRKPTDEGLPPQVHGNNLLEVAWTIVPTIIVGVIFFLSWQTLNSVDAIASTPDVRIRADAARFQWQFEYLDATGQNVTFKQQLPELVVPAGEIVHLDLRSADVIHAFYVPQFLFKRDVIPGRDNNFDFKVDASMAGQTFRGQCAELCGFQHWVMQFTVKALAPKDYDAWLQQQIKAAAATPPPASAGPSTAGGPGASGATGAGPTVQISAHNIAFSQSTVTAPANTAFTIHFDNQDQGVPHDIAIAQGSPTGQQVFKGDIVTGAAATDYHVPALPAGTYSFVCTVHPNMTGTLTVQ